MCHWVVQNLGRDVPMHFTAFHPDFRMRDHAPTRASTLTRARRIALAAGVHHAYTGNVYDPEGAQTLCHACGASLIEREGYTVTSWHLDDEGQCASCGTRCPGVFEPQPGHWGSRYAPVRLAEVA